MEKGDGLLKALETPDSGPIVMVSDSDEVLRVRDLALLQSLTAAELRRAASFRFDRDRRDFLAAHLLVRICASQLLDTPANLLVLNQRCPTCLQSGHGVPSLEGRPGIHVSLSHSRGRVMAAADLKPVGVDIEMRTDMGLEIATQVLAPKELLVLREDGNSRVAFLRHWARKEALIKIGRATLETLAQIDLSSLMTDAARVQRSCYGDLHFLDWEEPGRGAVAAIASIREANVIMGADTRDRVR